MQQIFAGAGRYEAFRRYLFTHGAHHIFLVCGASFDRMTVRQELAVLREGGVTFTRFSAFEPNSRYASVVAGVQQFRASGADALLAVGGGSAMDVAKCIKLYSNMNPARNYLEQPMVPNALPFAVVPTTAGHAMCYKLTSRYGLPHGQAAALCVAVLWPYMLEHVEDAADARGAAYLHEMFQALAQAMGERDAATAAASFAAYVQELGMAFPRGTAQAADVLELAQSVNPVRLKNHPIRLTGTGIASLYRTLLHL